MAAGPPTPAGNPYASAIDAQKQVSPPSNGNSQGDICTQMIDMLIRRPKPEEHDAVRALVQTIVDDTYGDLWAPPPLPIDEDWLSSWIATQETKIIGVVQTRGEWLDDLWVLR